MLQGKFSRSVVMNLSRKERRRMEREAQMGKVENTGATPEEMTPLNDDVPKPGEGDTFTRLSVEELEKKMEVTAPTTVETPVGTVVTPEVKKSRGRPKGEPKPKAVRVIDIRLNNKVGPWATIRSTHGCRQVHQEVKARLEAAGQANDKTTIVCTYRDSDKPYNPKGTKKADLTLPAIDCINWAGIEEPSPLDTGN
jgi:hypothetical protein